MRKKLLAIYIIITFLLVSCNKIDEGVVLNTFTGQFDDISFVKCQAVSNGISFELNNEQYINPKRILRFNHKTFIDEIEFSDAFISFDEFTTKPRNILVEFYIGKKHISSANLNDFMFYDAEGEKDLNNIGFEYLKAESLYIDNAEELQNIDSLASLPNLRILYLTIWNDITDISIFTECQNLSELHLALLRNIENIEVISNIENLKVLDLFMVPTSYDFSFLDQCENLELLHFAVVNNAEIGELHQGIKAVYFESCTNLKTSLLDYYPNTLIVEVSY